jgi:hypothetical protein
MSNYKTHSASLLSIAVVSVVLLEMLKQEKIACFISPFSNSLFPLSLMDITLLRMGVRDSVVG